VTLFRIYSFVFCTLLGAQSDTCGLSKRSDGRISRNCTIAGNVPLFATNTRRVTISQGIYGFGLVCCLDNTSFGCHITHVATTVASVIPVSDVFMIASFWNSSPKSHHASFNVQVI